MTLLPDYFWFAVVEDEFCFMVIEGDKDTIGGQE
jgi:hypothetical protein